MSNRLKIKKRLPRLPNRLRLGNAPGGNYEFGLLGLDVVPGSATLVTVGHDDWCALLQRGEPCNCNPEIEAESLETLLRKSAT